MSGIIIPECNQLFKVNWDLYTYRIEKKFFLKLYSHDMLYIWSLSLVPYRVQKTIVISWVYCIIWSLTPVPDEELLKLLECLFLH